MWYSNLGKIFISRHVLHQYWYTCPIVFPVRRNLQNRSFWLLSQPLPHLRFNLFIISEIFATFLDSIVNRFTWQTLPNVNRKYFFLNILCIESMWPQKARNTTLLFGSTPLKNGRHFDYWNQPLNVFMRVCYLGFHEAGLFCYIVIHTENLLHPFHERNNRRTVFSIRFVQRYYNQDSWSSEFSWVLQGRLWR
jgi:hypothetical protein